VTGALARARAQAAGFAVLVAGTLVYARGDQHEANALQEKHEEHKPERRPFRFFHTIAAHPRNGMHVHRWRNAADRVRSALHLEGSHHHDV
jgi:hypothetical protein